LGARSGEYGGCSSTVVCLLAKNTLTVIVLIQAPTFSRRHTKTHSDINRRHSESDCHTSTTTKLWNAEMPTSSNHTEVSVHCCDNKHTVMSSRTLLSDPVQQKTCMYMDTWQVFFNILHYTSSQTEVSKPRMRTGVGACILLGEIFAHSSLEISAFIIHIRITAKANFETHLRLYSGSPNIAEHLNAGANSRMPFHFKKYSRQTRSFYSFPWLSFETESTAERKRIPRTVLNGYYLTGRVGSVYGR
jgi:hypothetical protein